MIAVCPSCAASNSCPETLAGLTICCRKCKTQVTVGDAAGARPPRWYATPYWIVVCVAELAVAAALAVCIVAFLRDKPPPDIPLLGPEATGAGVALPAPGTQVTFTWTTDLASAGGHFGVAGQNVVLCGSGQTPLPDVAVRQKPWPMEVFQPSQAPPARPIVLEFRVALPDDPELAGARVTLNVAANVEYPGWTRPDGPVSLQQCRVSREWAFTVATHSQQDAYDQHLLGRGWLRAGSIVLGVLLIAIPFAAGLLAQRSISVQCPKCSRITVATYHLGGSKLYMSPCPHHGSRPVEVRRAR